MFFVSDNDQNCLNDPVKLSSSPVFSYFIYFAMSKRPKLRLYDHCLLNKNNFSYFKLLSKSAVF